MLLVEEAGGYATLPAPAEGARLDAPFVSAPGIARPLADAANLWLGRRVTEVRSARITHHH